MACETSEGNLQHDFARACGPRTLALDILETFEEATNIEQQTCEFRTDGIECLMHVLPCRDHCFGKHAGAFAPGGMAAGRQRFRPVGCCSRHQVRARELHPQSFSRLQLMRFDQGTPVASASARKPDEWTFGFIDGDAGAAEVGDDVPLAQRKMLRTKAIDGRLSRWRDAAR
jgi:hypothetical protein